MNWLDELEATIAKADAEGASGLILETRSPEGYRQLIGPFSKEDASIYEAIERLQAEAEGDGTDYSVSLLFPVTSTYVVHPNYNRINGTPRLAPWGDICLCGGIRYYHASEPLGCDDCPCESFRPAGAEAPSLPPPPGLREPEPPYPFCMSHYRAQCIKAGRCMAYPTCAD
jgi:hypothetical protein